MSFFTIACLVLAFALLLPFYRVLRGPTVFDRMLGVSVIGTKTVILICLVGFIYDQVQVADPEVVPDKRHRGVTITYRIIEGKAYVYLFGRLDMFVDIALAYAMLNFIGAVVVAKYLDTTGGEAQ